MMESPSCKTWMVVEHFRSSDAVPVYRRFRERGRMAPDGLHYVSSWVTADMTRCYQVMAAPDRALRVRPEIHQAIEELEG